jgi:hypothetical protein
MIAENAMTVDIGFLWDLGLSKLRDVIWKVKCKAETIN